MTGLRVVAQALVVVACCAAAPTAEAQPDAASSSRVREDRYRRGCESSVYGELGPLGDHPEEQVVRAGPVRFLHSWRSDQPDLFEATPSRPAPLKTLIVVDAGRVATVTVPRSERTRLVLLYDLRPPPSGRAHYVMADGDTAVTFEACESGTGPFGAYQVTETQFNGSLLVARRACFQLRVIADAKRYEAVLAIGVSRCDAQSHR